jgi:hypothetical protein
MSVATEDEDTCKDMADISWVYNMFDQIQISCGIIQCYMIR